MKFAAYFRDDSVCDNAEAMLVETFGDYMSLRVSELRNDGARIISCGILMSPANAYVLGGMLQRKLIKTQNKSIDIFKCSYEDRDGRFICIEHGHVSQWSPNYGAHRPCEAVDPWFILPE